MSNDRSGESSSKARPTTRDWRVPITGHGALIIRADSAQEAADEARDYAGRATLYPEVDETGMLDWENREAGEFDRAPENVEDGASNRESGSASVSVPEVPRMEQLATARERAGLTIATVATKMGVARTTVSGWENGRSRPTLTDARRYANIIAEEGGA